MKTCRQILNILVVAIIPLFVLSVPLSALAANCDKKPDHPDCIDPPPDDGGNDTADPDWQILAVNPDGSPTFDSNTCVAFNPDLKGPGIAYGGFYENFGYETCAEATTSTNAVIALKTLNLQVDQSGQFSTIQLRGRNPDNGVVYESNVVSLADPGPEADPAPVSEGYFTLQVRAAIDMYSCGTSRPKRHTVCDQYAGTITLHDLEYCPVGKPCP